MRITNSIYIEMFYEKKNLFRNKVDVMLIYLNALCEMLETIPKGLKCEKRDDIIQWLLRNFSMKKGYGRERMCRRRCFFAQHDTHTKNKRCLVVS